MSSQPLHADPIGYALSYVPVALAIIAMIMAFLPAGILFLLEAMAHRRRGEGPRETPGAPAAPEPERAPTPA